MPQSIIDVREHSFEQALGVLLRTGVIISALVVLIGGVLLLVQQGDEPAPVNAFHGEPANLRSLEGIMQDALALRAQGIIQFGLLLLMLTPILRVFFSVLAFILQKDFLYTCLTLVVLSILLYSLFSEGMH
jgi:uncharacterized membrane protein